MSNFIKTHKDRLIFIAKNLIILFIVTNITQSLLTLSNTHYNYFLVALTIGSLAIALYNMFVGDSVKKAYHQLLKYIWLEYFIFIAIVNVVVFIKLYVVQLSGPLVASTLAFFGSWFLLLPKVHFIWQWLFAGCWAYISHTLASFLITFISTDSLYSQVIQHTPEIEIGLLGATYMIGGIIGLVLYNSLTKED
jgi:hypothetical protein